MKLTLSIDNNIIEAAKAYAAGRNKSLSSLTEGFYKDLVSKDTGMAFIRQLRKRKPIADFDHKTLLPTLFLTKFK
jgi:Family of unknown function (DUF6364)